VSGIDSRLEHVLAPVAEGMARMRSVLDRQIQESSRAVGDMTDHVGRFRGKELRGALVLLAGDATGNATDEHPAIAAIVEMIHLATLVHDDVLDGAKVRRRVACVNQRWDNQTAVLLGDFLYARAFALSTDLSSRLASRVLSETTRRICVSEIEQAARRYDFDLSESAYEEISGGKTASLYSAACELGARYPGGRDEAGLLLRRFGWEMGLAFQIVDDCLDLAGTPLDLHVGAAATGADRPTGPEMVKMAVDWEYERRRNSKLHRLRRHAALAQHCLLADGH
jgi:octaprenyl-diphosphate synthase